MLAEVDKVSMSVDDAKGVKAAHEHVFTVRLDGRHGHPVAVYHPHLALLQHRLESLDSQVKTRRDWPHLSGQPKELTQDQLRAALSYYTKSRVCYANGVRNNQKGAIAWMFCGRISGAGRIRPILDWVATAGLALVRKELLQ